MAKAAGRQFLALLTHTVTLSHRTAGTADAYGQPAYSYVAYATAVACLAMPNPHRANSDEVEMGVWSDIQLSDFELFLAHRADVAPTDHAAVTGFDQASGKTLEVLAVRNSGGQDHHLEVYARLVD